MLTLSSEQLHSAHSALRRGNVRHHDETEIEIAVGVYAQANGAHFAYCSASVRTGKVVRRAPWFYRLLRFLRILRIRGAVTYQNQHEIAEKLLGKTGVAYMKGTVFTNGHVELRIDPSSVRVYPVERRQEGNLRKDYGQALTEKVLAQVA